MGNVKANSCECFPRHPLVSVTLHRKQQDAAQRGPRLSERVRASGSFIHPLVKNQCSMQNMKTKLTKSWLSINKTVLMLPEWGLNPFKCYEIGSWTTHSVPCSLSETFELFIIWFLSKEELRSNFCCSLWISGGHCRRPNCNLHKLIINSFNLTPSCSSCLRPPDSPVFQSNNLT